MSQAAATRSPAFGWHWSFRIRSGIRQGLGTPPETRCKAIRGALGRRHPCRLTVSGGVPNPRRIVRVWKKRASTGCLLQGKKCQAFLQAWLTEEEECHITLVVTGLGCGVALEWLRRASPFSSFSCCHMARRILGAICVEGLIPICSLRAINSLWSIYQILVTRYI